MSFLYINGSEDDDRFLAGNQSFMANSRGWTDGGTVWEAEFYDQPLGRPLGRSVQQGYLWRRDFEHVSISLDAWKREANFTGGTLQQSSQRSADS